MDVERLFKAMHEQEATDLFLKVGNRPFLRIHGSLIPVGSDKLSREEITEFAVELMGPDRRQLFHAERELNFAFDRAGIGRFRANVLWQKGTIALVIRRISRLIPPFDELHLPSDVLKRLINEQHGPILITGPTDSGKSTTIASMLDYINQHVARHIVTLEDPIEFQFEEEQAIINQREVGVDTRSFSEGLRNVLRQSPDVLFVSDIRDKETMESCLLAAEAGQLVVSCIHTNNIVTTIERLVAFFPAHQHQLIRLRLSLVLRGVISLRLLLRQDETGRIPACEVLVSTPIVRDYLREGKTELLPGVLQDSAMYGMQSFTQALYQLYRQGEVSLEEALRSADSPEDLQLAVREIRPTREAKS